MKKNGQYVGVDEKYVPEDEKYVENNLNDEIKGDFHNVYKGAKEYVSDKDNQEKFKNAGKKGFKIAKGIGIGYIAVTAFVVLMAIAIFVLVFVRIAKSNRQADEISKNATNIYESITDGMSDVGSKMYAESFNIDIEHYSGTNYGSDVVNLLEKVVIKIKKNTDHTITVSYKTTTTSKPDEITTLKKQFDISTQYEVSMDYDSNGYINKITITDY